MNQYFPSADVEKGLGIQINHYRVRLDRWNLIKNRFSPFYSRFMVLPKMEKQ